MKPFYRNVFTLTLVFLGIMAQAQTAQRFTLQQCIDYALLNSATAQNAVLDEKIAAARVKETVGLGLPQVTASAGIQHNQKLRRFFTTYNPSGGFIDLSGVPGIQPGDVVSAQNFFQLKSAGDVGGSINQLIFNGSYLVGLQAANAYKEFAVKNANVTREQLVQTVTKAYYSVLINRERVRVFEANIGRLDSLLSNTKALNKNGFAESIDVDRLQVQLNNLTTEFENFKNINIIVQELLKFQMGYPMDQPIEVEGNIQDLNVVENIDSYSSDFDYTKRGDYLVLQANHRLQSLNIKNQYAGALPSIYGFANLGFASQSPTVGGLFKTNTNIKDDGTVGPDKWYSYSLFGVSLSWNLFTGFSRQYKIQQEKLTLLKIENGFRNLKAAIDLDTKQTTLTYQNSLKTLDVQKQNMELASNVARITKIKLDQGVGSNLEVIDAESSLKTAQVNYYNALFDAMVAKIDLDKAYGKLITPKQ